MLKIKKPTKEHVLRFIKRNSLIIIGTAILAFGVGIFIVPFDLVTGGVSGLAVIINEMTGGKVSVDLSVTIITWALFFLGLLILGKAFSLRTLCSTIVYPVFLHFSLKMVEWIPFLQLDTSSEVNMLLAAIFSGVMVGAGCAITFIGGGSTGGLDILAFILAKFTPIKSSVYVFIIDGTIVALGFIFFKQLPLCLMGIISAFIVAIVIDKIFLGESKVFMAYIVTDKHEEITSLIHKKIDRTTTIIDCEGGYSKQSKKMLAVCFTMSEYNGLIEIVSSVDKHAFMTINRAHAINGEGFDPLPSKRKD